MSARNPLLDAALAYASRGWPVFPCKPDSKRPLTEHGVKDATTDPDIIRGWWTQWPNALIGFACGHASGVFVLDLDVEDDPNGAKLRALIATLEAELGVTLPPTWEVV